MTLSGSIFPKAIGGLEELAQLSALRQSGRPQYVMRGDGTPMGWFAIESHSANSSYLDAQGVGQRIDVQIKLRRAGAPPATSFFSLMQGFM